ncbi:MAG: hypothetical protein A2126_03735 [Candidatus Woykebacteria bacterium GWB1_45_5]|uniref:Uncharacterized protein n=1 Tax=Candidatus Woykebacteria bacterium GWB1_45_5 TaxID=1802592 RepID=A0A1G1W7P5_9BACT|nr:MAG: hypothetical protein A2126_03735 [Candidatus Woykebacteria bacterium GWB1_45_5]
MKVTAAFSEQFVNEILSHFRVRSVKQLKLFIVVVLRDGTFVDAYSTNSDEVARERCGQVMAKALMEGKPLAAVLLRRSSGSKLKYVDSFDSKNLV